MFWLPIHWILFIFESCCICCIRLALVYLSSIVGPCARSLFGAALVEDVDELTCSSF